MDERNRTILVFAIAITVLAAVFVSFGLPSLTGSIPTVVLPDVEQSVTEELGGEFLPVDITPETVQTVIADTLTRPESYYREVTVTLFWTANGRRSSGQTQVEIWADDGYVKTVTSSAGAAEYRLVGDGKLYLWYAEDKTWKETTAQEDSGDLAQRILTYEDVLALPQEQIVDARYEAKDGTDCIYVEAQEEGLDQVNCYWIETATGLLYAAAIQEDGETVYEMAQTTLRTPLESGVSFALPDGTVLHESAGEE
jgi:hypothetical protein